MSNPGGLRQDVKPTSGYIISLAFASTGIVFLGIGLGGNVLARNGGDPMDALGTDAIVTLVFAFSFGYALRLIFWRRSPPRLRNAVRAIITTILILCLGVTAASLILAWRLPNETHHLFIARWFSVYAAICQMSSIIWLVRYRGEGLR